MTLQGKKVVVLGGSAGIGLAISQAAAAEGASLVIASSQQDRVNHALTTLPAGAVGSTLDLTETGAVHSFFDRLGEIDHLVYTAGEALQLGLLPETDIAQAQKFFRVRYWGAFVAAQAAASHIRAGGSITFTSGIAGARPRAGWAVAASICAAMEGLTRALAVELAPTRINIVSPGVVKTALWSRMAEAEREALYEQTANVLPVGHAGETEEIAQAYVYLMKQTYGTGQVVVVDGGAVLV